MLARERLRGFATLRRISALADRTARNGLAKAPSMPQRMESLSDFPVSVWMLQTRGFKMVPRKNFIRARSSAGGLVSPLDISTTNNTESAEMAVRRKASYAPPQSETRFKLWNDEDLLLEKEAAVLAAAEERLTPQQFDGDYDDELLGEELASQSEVLAAENHAVISVVEAYYVAKTIDLAPLIMSTLARDAPRKKYTRTHLLIELPSDAAKKRANPSYVAVYRFGSVVFFNVSPRFQIQILEAVKRFAAEPQAKGFEPKDSFGVCVMPSAPRTRVTPEHCIVPELNMNAVAVISEVMAQSVALESYSEIVDSLLDNFGSLNSEISSSSKVELDKKLLFSKIAQNNRIFIDLISKLRIKGRSEIAWEKMEYEVIHSGMIKEFELDDRFELIQFKLDLIQENSKLFLEVIQHQKSASLEWIIVVLILFECILMCLEMSGQGSVLFDSIKDLLPK
jgi:uncharacterized Rmd1/YagE family protein